MSNTFLLAFLVSGLATALVLVNWPLIYRKPVPGEIWRAKPSKPADPFSAKPEQKVEILDVRQGWVRYRWLGAALWQDERRRMKIFVYCWEPTAPALQSPPPQSPARP